ncbi:recombinase family protein [Actinomadura decatromicini]|uniref:Resolvase/invertase-type recombinase catalytic domain-containing protein n=1 Tax=Actinomadura decatromicini TaxID=2604572 RepID=A0A5D3FG10_9ACTN|nr:recombinase family protein [Actinomadura decatromicini]TYK47191.1 hypothetical protein FXF68_25675 [Actinomadura decatromicini]
MPPHTPKPAIGYIRVSTAREEMISPEIQEKSIREWATRNNRTIVDIIVDLDKSGRNFKRRVQEAVEGIRDGRAKEILVYKFSRFGRQRHGWAVHLDLVESAKGELISTTEEVDARTAAGKFTRGMLAEVAAFESDRASEQWIDTLEWRLSRGLPKTGGPRWGYIRKGRVLVPGEEHHYRTDPDDPLGERYEPDPDLVDAYVSLYVRYVTGEAAGPKLASWLNHHGHVTTRGTVWSVQTLYAVMDSGFAAGYLSEHDKNCPCPPKRRQRCRNLIYHPGAHKAIIDEELWQAYLRKRKERTGLMPRARGAMRALSGLLVCGGCAWSLTAISGPNGPGYAYRCGRWGQVPACTKAYVRRVVAEAEVRDQLREWAAEIDAARQAAAADVVVPAPAPKIDVDKIAEKIARIDKALARLRKMRALDDDDDRQAEREYQDARAELLDDRAALEAQLEEAQREQAPPTQEELGPMIAGVLEGWDVLTGGEKNALLLNIIRVIRVHRQEEGPARLDIVPVWAPADT